MGLATLLARIVTGRSLQTVSLALWASSSTSRPVLVNSVTRLVPSVISRAGRTAKSAILGLNWWELSVGRFVKIMNIGKQTRTSAGVATPVAPAVKEPKRPNASNVRRASFFNWMGLAKLVVSQTMTTRIRLLESACPAISCAVNVSGVPTTSV